MTDYYFTFNDADDEAEMTTRSKIHQMYIGYETLEEYDDLVAGDVWSSRRTNHV